MVNPAQFAKEVEREAKKVVWPTWRETRTATIMVFIMVTLASIFMFVADFIISWGIQKILGVNS